MKVLLLSPYDTDSHRYWRRFLVENLKDIEWTVVTLPGRYFSWRTRGNALSLLTQKEQFVGRAFDHILTTSMLDIACFKSMFPEFANIKITTYFHENQFEYPVSSKQQTSAELHIWSIYNALLSDKVVFNSEFNRKTFFSAAKGFLGMMPDLVPKNVLQTAERNSEVIPVPIPKYNVVLKRNRKRPRIRLLWNHRWEYDKAPDKFLKVLHLLKEIRPDFELVLLGKGEILPEILKDFSEHIVKSGFVESRDEYLEIISECDFIVSSAIHEFQGISVLEAVSLGCCPILPNRVVYPYLFPKKYLYQSHLNDGLKEAKSMVKLLDSFASGELSVETDELMKVVDRFHWSELENRYRKCLR